VIGCSSRLGACFNTFSIKDVASLLNTSKAKSILLEIKDTPNNAKIIKIFKDRVTARMWGLIFQQKESYVKLQFIAHSYINWLEGI
jgi:hypothetical protein